MTVEDDLRELGLLPSTCDYWIKKWDRPCKQQVVPGSRKCLYHGGAVEALEMSAAQYRTSLQTSVMPLALVRLVEILEDEHAAHPDILRAVFGVMDRVWLGPTQNIELSGHVETRPPLEMLQTMLNGIASRLQAAELPAPERTIEDAEVVEGPDGEVA